MNNLPLPEQQESEYWKNYYHYYGQSEPTHHQQPTQTLDNHYYRPHEAVQTQYSHIPENLNNVFYENPVQPAEQIYYDPAYGVYERQYSGPAYNSDEYQAPNPSVSRYAYYDWQRPAENLQNLHLQNSQPAQTNYDPSNINQNYPSAYDYTDAGYYYRA